MKKRVNISVIILVFLFILYAGSRLRKNEKVEPESFQFEVPPYAEIGLFDAGTQSLKIENDKPLEITIWYPAFGDGSQNREIIYPYEVKFGKPLGAVKIASSAGKAIRNAAFDLSGNPYPLVVLSPGFSIGSTAYAWLGEHLASYGFVVVAPEHQEHLNPEDQLWRSAITRPQDILALFSYLDEQVLPGGQFEGLINTEVVAVIGHSYGGYTTLATGGAQIDMTGLQSHCQQAIEEEHSAAQICEILISHQADMAELAGQDPNSDDLWPAWADPRVDAIVPIAGDAFFFGEVGLAEIDIPVMAIGGTADVDSPYLWGTHPSFEYSSGSRKTEVALIDAEHMLFTGQCEQVRWYLKFFTGEFCKDSNWEREYAHQITKHFTTAFLLAELKADHDAAAVLSSEIFDLNDVNFQSEGY